MNRFGVPASLCYSCQIKHKKKGDAAYGKENRQRHNKANQRYRRRTKKPVKISFHLCDCGKTYKKIHNGGRIPSRCPECTKRHRLAKVRLSTERRKKENPEYFRQYRQDNSEKLTKKALQWAKNNPDKHRERGTRYRSRKYSAVVEYFTREEVGDRDGWICAVCTLPVDKTLRHPDPMAGEHDHVIPVTHPNYPGNTWKNAAIVHSRCNKRKGGFRGRSHNPIGPTSSKSDT